MICHRCAGRGATTRLKDGQDYGGWVTIAETCEHCLGTGKFIAPADYPAALDAYLNPPRVCIDVTPEYRPEYFNDD